MRFSRHARNNMRLYKISESDIMETIESPDSADREMNKRTSLKGFSNRFSGYPLKVVYDIIEGEIMVITAYPLKRKRWR